MKELTESFPPKGGRKTEGGYMFTRFFGRILHAIYPVLVLGVVLTAWSSASLSDVLLSPPPIGNGFHFFWNPNLSTQNSCSNDRSQAISRSCAVTSAPSSLEQFTNHQKQTLIKTN